MSDIVLVVLTSEGCGHCSQFRGNGVLGNGTPFHTYSFLDTHIDPLQKGENITVINIHFSSMTGQHNQIQVISKFIKKGKTITQERYFSENGNTFVNVLSVNQDNKPRVILENQQVNIDSKQIDWLSFLNLKIPKNIEKYTFYYPCFLIFKKQDWKNKGNILGIPNAGLVIKDEDGNYGLEKSGQGLQQRNFLPQKLLIEAMNKKLDFTPMKDLQKEKPVVKKVEDVEVKEVEESKQIKEVEESKQIKEVEESKNYTLTKKNSENRTFVIRSYHDE